ncbi:unnamed protein product [Protopolystoma xenopodis]|uniref:VHS domain-containing protein n=1 Tax=Protopolystoma xenopodis TaxID=117903 RepID=A0A448X331_9PLAT|nr:unnamed protein product [Protopolystoma xenopodis]
MLNHIVAGYTLSLLETCVKNCGYRFHIVLANREALHDFTKFLQPGGNDLIPIRIQDKLLRIIQVNKNSSIYTRHFLLLLDNHKE